MNPILLKLAPYVLLGGAVFGLKHCYDKDIRDKAVADERGKVATAYRDTIGRSLDSAALVVKRDTIRLTKTKVERDTFFEKANVDSILKANKPVPVEIVKEIIRVDSQVIAACEIVKLSCQEENRLFKLDIIKSEDQTKAALSLQPSFGRQVSTHTIAGLAGALACFFWCPREAK